MNAKPILNYLDQTLLPLGFERKKATWNRRHGMFTDVIDVQVSKSLKAVTMNIGVLEKSVHLICWGSEAEPFIEQPFCTIRARIGELIDGHDKWWETSNTQFKEDMAMCIKSNAIPFLNSMHELAAMREWLKSSGSPSPRNPLQTVNFAVLQHILGEHDQACSILLDLKERALGAWKQRAQEVADRIACSQFET